MVLSFVFCDYANEYHCESFALLIGQYMADPMGDSKPLTPMEQLRLVDGMSKHPAGFVLFAVLDEEIIGLVTCFINFSTFKARPYLNIHDVLVKKDYRGNGYGRLLLEKCVALASERKYCKVTLEVRSDNLPAQMLYKSMGFKDSNPTMYFLTKELL